MRLLSLGIIFLLYGCSFQAQHEERQTDFNMFRDYCDKTYPGDPFNSTIIGVFKCPSGYRLVFASYDHHDYYMDKKAEFYLSCRPSHDTEECSKLLKECSRHNMCRG